MLKLDERPANEKTRTRFDRERAHRSDAQCRHPETSLEERRGRGRASMEGFMDAPATQAFLGALNGDTYSMKRTQSSRSRVQRVGPARAPRW